MGRISEVSFWLEDEPKCNDPQTRFYYVEQCADKSDIGLGMVEEKAKWTHV